MSKEQEKEAKDTANEMMGEQGNEETSEQVNLANIVMSSLMDMGENIDGAIVVLYKKLEGGMFQLSVSVREIPPHVLYKITSELEIDAIEAGIASGEIEEEGTNDNNT